MNKAMRIGLATILVVGVAVAGVIYTNWNAFVPIAAMGRAICDQCQYW